IRSGSTTTHSDISLPEYDSFIFDLSNDQFPPTDRSAFTHEGFGDKPGHIMSPPEYDCFYFRDLPNSGELISSLNSGICENLSSTTCVNLPVEDDYSPLLAYVVWIFLAYLTIPGNLKTLAKGFYPSNKILVPKPPKNCARCAKCGHPVNGPYCQGCALLRERLEEDLVSYLKYFHDISESFDDSTNVVNAPREPVVDKQDHGVNPPSVDECCCECGNALDGIYCQQCICKSCGKGAHTGYNCPPKVPIISNPEPCNQTINNELPQTLPSFDSVPCVSKPNFVDESSKIFNPPPQPPIYSCEFCRSNAQYGHYCTPQAQFINPEPGYSQDFNFPQYIHNFQQQYFCCDQCGGPHETFQCQQIIFHELCCENCEDPHENFQCQPKIPACCDDDDDDDDVDCTIAITAILSTKETDNSLSMGDEHLDTISATESDEVIKSNVKDLVPIPSESEGIPDTMCDVHFNNNHTPLEAKDHVEIVINSNDDISSSDDDSLYKENIEYVEASPHNSKVVSLEAAEIVIPEVEEIEDDNLREKLLNVHLLIANIEALKDNPTPSSELLTKSSSTSLNSFLEETNTFHNSLPEFENFCFDFGEISSGSTTTHSDISLPEYKVFSFDDDHIKEISSSSTTTHSDISLPEYEVFSFDDDHIKEISSSSTTTHSDISLSKYDSFIFDFANEDIPEKLKTLAKGFYPPSLNFLSFNWESYEKYARELEAESNRTIDWDEVIDHVNKKAKEDLVNVAGFKMDYIKGMSYDDIRYIFEAKFDSNMTFLLKTKEHIDEEESRALKSINKTPSEKAANRKKLDKEVEELKRHLQIVPNEENDVYTEATPLARKVPIVDYGIIIQNNKPYYKIKRADAQELSDDFLLITLGAMFEKPDIHAQIRKNQRSVHGQAEVKSWKILESCDHDTSQDPIVNLEGVGGSEQDQAKLPHDSPLLGFLLWRLSRMLKEILTLMARIKKLEKRWEENAKSGPTKDDSAELDAELDEDIEYIDTKEAMNKGRQSIVDTARPDDDTGRPDVSTDTLIKLKDDKAKGVAFKDSEVTNRPARSILTLKPLPTIDPKGKRKGVLEEPESAKKMTKSDFDAAQIARQLEVELQAEVEREIQREEQASMDYIANLYDEVQARIDANHELAELIADFVPIRSEEDERRIRDMNKKAEEESNDK
nr:hypothetical protein [Tanacetum cinerariifolium]